MASYCGFGHQIWRLQVDDHGGRWSDRLPLGWQWRLTFGLDGLQVSLEHGFGQELDRVSRRAPHSAMLPLLDCSCSPDHTQGRRAGR